jgi:HEAT repeat protein
MRHPSRILSLLGLTVLILAPQVLGQTGEIYLHPHPQENLEARWAWAQEQAERLSTDDGFWIGYSIKRLVREFTYFISEGSSSFTTTTSRLRIPSGVTLQERIYGRKPGQGTSDEEAIKELARQALEERDVPYSQQKKVWKDVALIFRFNPRDSKQPSRLHFSSLDVPFETDGLPMFWLDPAEDGESFALVRGLFEKSKDIKQQKRFLSAVGFHSDSERVVSFLENVLQSRAPEELRARAASELEDHPVPRSLDLLRETAFKDRSLDVRKRAVSALEDLEMEGAVDVLIELAKHGDHPDIRKRAISTLGDLASRKAAEALVDFAYNDPEADIQRRAVYALEDLPDNEGIPYLIKIAQTHPHPQVRKSAIHCLGDSGDSRALDALISILKK